MDASPASDQLAGELQFESEQEFVESVPRDPSRHTSSKYDFVKVRVWLGENLDHYYVLSRFLISRMLTVTKIPQVVAIKIALELKKLLVDASLLDISQSDLETNLFNLMQRRGFGSEFVNRYLMMTRFYHLRVPLVIMVCGTCCVGKSVIATQLAQRLNLPNVLQTEMVYELLRTSPDSPLHPTPIWQERHLSNEDLILEYKRECRIVHKGLNGELKKGFRDGKPVIIEGLHIDPSLYIEEIPNLILSCSKGNIASFSNEVREEEREEDGERGKAFQPLERLSESESRSKSIIIQILLKMEEEDHQSLLNEWIVYQGNDLPHTSEEKSNLLARLQRIQNYLSSFSTQGLKVIDISPTNFPKVLDSIHDYVLMSIERYFARELPE